MIKQFLFLFGLILICPPVCWSQDNQQSGSKEYWPGWLGANRDGWVSYFTPPANWPKELNQKWQTLVGVGYATPLVVDGRIYQHGRIDEEEVLSCLDLKTGKVLWQKKSETLFKMGGGGERHGKGPKSNPVFSEGRIFTMSITGILSAWDAKTGKQLWTREYSFESPKNTPYWGASSSPIVDENRVIIHFGTDKEGFLTALDVRTGSEIWQQGREGASYSSPLLEEIHGVKQIIQWNHENLVGVESKTGKLLWTHPYPHVEHNQNMPTPTFHDGTILLGAENRGIRCFKPEFAGGKWSVSELWFQENLALDMSTAVVNGSSLYGFSHYKKGKLFCLDTKTGEIQWEGPARTGQNVAFISMPGYVAALIDDGELRILSATSKDYSPVASYKTAEVQSWAAPVFLKDGVLVKGKDKLTYWSF